jgi:tRNA modification GTPase
MVFETEDTIAAIATPYGRSALGTIRISGADSFPITSKVFVAKQDSGITPYRPTVGKIFTQSHEIDEALLIYFQKPHSYTKEDLIEITCHGNPLILDQVLASLLNAGARHAKPGEFTYRAFLNGRIDLVQAAAVHDLISADSVYQAELALSHLEGKLSGRLQNLRAGFIELISLLEGNIDFSEEQHYNFIDQPETLRHLNALTGQIDELLGTFERGRLIREGFHIAIVGKPNVGKSSIFNALLEESRAIVTAIPGTTRDYLKERMTLGNFLVQFLDTAGIRESEEEIEQEGIRRTRQVIEKADLILFVLDGSVEPDDLDRALWTETEGKARFTLRNKSDLSGFRESQWYCERTLAISAITGDGINELRSRIQKHMEERVRYTGEDFLISNIRHREILESVRLGLGRAMESVEKGRSEEFAMVDLHQALAKVGEITGEVTIEDVYQHIFSNFCIGK